MKPGSWLPLRRRASPWTHWCALVAAMQASPYREIDLGVARHRFPVRDVGL
jgi:hypothetical protein